MSRVHDLTNLEPRDDDLICIRIDELHKIFETADARLQDLQKSGRVSSDDALMRTLTVAAADIAQMVLKRYAMTEAGARRVQHNEQVRSDSPDPSEMLPYIDHRAVMQVASDIENLATRAKGEALSWATGDGRAGGYTSKVDLNDHQKAVLAGLGLFYGERLGSNNKAFEALAEIIDNDLGVEVSVRSISDWPPTMKSHADSAIRLLVNRAELGKVGDVQMCWSAPEMGDDYEVFRDFVLEVTKSWN